MNLVVILDVVVVKDTMVNVVIKTIVSNFYVRN